MIGLLYAGIECVVEKERAVHDIYNAIVAGGTSGAIMGAWPARYMGTKGKI